MLDRDIIFFDLDGTLTDSAPGVMNSFHHALTQFGIEPESHEELRRVVGPPLKYSFTVTYGVPVERFPEIMEHYLSYYLPKGMFENSVYPGVEELLKRLRTAGKRLAVASSKWQYGVNTVMEHYGLDKYFDFLGGSEESEGRIEKADVIRWMLRSMDIRDLSRVLMVGDRKYDVEGARECGIDTVGVLWGYGTADELTSAGATAVAETPDALAKMLGA